MPLFLSSTTETPLALLATIDPVSQAAGTVTTNWISVHDFNAYLVLVGVGVMQAGSTVDAKIQQATDASGTGFKDLGVSITQLLAAGGNNRQAKILLRRERNFDAGYAYFRLSITVGVAASLIHGAIFGNSYRHGGLPLPLAASVAQVIPSA